MTAFSFSPLAFNLGCKFNKVFKEEMENIWLKFFVFEKALPSIKPRIKKVEF